MPNLFDDRDSFIHKIYNEYYTKLENMCLQKVSNIDSAYGDLISSCIQDVFMLAYQSYDILVEHENVEAWLKKTCSNRLIPYKIRLDEKKSKIVPLELVDHMQLINELDVSETVVNAISSQEFLEKLMPLLSESEKEVYVSYFVEHKTIEDIANKRNSSVASVKMVLNRIKNKGKRAREKNIFIFFVTFWVFRYFI